MGQFRSEILKNEVGSSVIRCYTRRDCQIKNHLILFVHQLVRFLGTAHSGFVESCYDSVNLSVAAVVYHQRFNEELAVTAYFKRFIVWSF